MNSTWVATAKLCGAIDRIFDEALRDFGVTVVEAHVLNALFKHDGQRATDLAHQVGRMKTSFTPNLDSLQEKGLIERTAHSVDRRAVVISLTSKAEAMREAFVERFADAESQAAAHLSGWIAEHTAATRLPIHQILKLK